MPQTPHPFYAFVRTALLGGLAVVLPVLIVAYLLRWLFRGTRDLIRPLTERVVAEAHIQALLADALVLVGLVGFCFLLGLSVRTRLGGWVHGRLEDWLFARVPGYQLIKDTVAQFIGQDRAPPFLGVCLARPYGGECAVTGFVTARHEDGRVTVFVPNAPLPTTGVVYHLPIETVEELPGVSIEQAMRTVMACGSGSAELLAAGAGARAGA